MKGGPGKNKQHMQMGGMVRPSGLGGAQITPGISSRRLAAQPRLAATPRFPMGNRRVLGASGYKHGGPVKKRKGYKHGGTVDTPEVSVMPNQPVTVPRLTKDGLRDIGQPVGYSHGGPVQKAQRKEPGGRLTTGDVRRAGLK